MRKTVEPSSKAASLREISTVFLHQKKGKKLTNMVARLLHFFLLTSSSYDGP
jgi:hypothetical protein